MSRSGKVHTLDVLRIAASCGVMAAHFLAHAHASLGLNLGMLERLNFVDLFFVLSGFLLASVYRDRLGTGEDFGRFTQARLARLYPLHATIALAFAGLGILLALVGAKPRVPSTFDPSLLPSHLTMLHAWNVAREAGLNFPSWSLSAEFFLLLVFPLLLVAQKRLGWRGMIALALAAALAFHTLCAARGGTHWTLAASEFGNFRALPFFIMGMAAADFARERKDLSLPWSVPLVLAGLVMLDLIVDAPHEASLLLFPALVASLALAERRGSPRLAMHPATTRLAALTYGVFLLHTMFGILLAQIIKTFAITSAPTVLALIIAAMVATFLASALTNRLIEQPALALLKPGGGRLAAFSPWLAGPGLRYAGYALPTSAVALSIFMVQRAVA